MVLVVEAGDAAERSRTKRVSICPGEPRAGLIVSGVLSVYLYFMYSVYSIVGNHVNWTIVRIVCYSYITNLRGITSTFGVVDEGSTSLQSPSSN